MFGIDMLNNKYVQEYLPFLLKDCTTNSDIKWDDKELIPRVHKRLQEQKERTKKKAEVFTPSWICNVMNNHLDEDWFERKDVFNIEIDKGWITNKDKIDFCNKDWKDYVLSTRLEITCGEAPFLVSRYDTTTGEYIGVGDRIGLLDRKLRVINENIDNKQEWFGWVIKAYQSTYGYEFQSDNLLIARINLFMTFIENYKYKWNIEPNSAAMMKIIDIISWNIWQMDGLKNTIPHTTTYATIMDWKENKRLLFKDIDKE